MHDSAMAAFVATNSVCQGVQVPIILAADTSMTRHEIVFAHTSFKWANLASHNAGVTVRHCRACSDDSGKSTIRCVDERRSSRERININAYLVGGPNRCSMRERQRPLDRVQKCFWATCQMTAAISSLRKQSRTIEVTRRSASSSCDRIYGREEFIKGMPSFASGSRTTTWGSAQAIQSFRQV